ncbi:MAG TPA: hypothetical protein DEQ80_08290 [Anaerolinea thermolimosa]|uniref:Uncharacterized protein n=2 Tax=Anaerolinea thermolimosa TaxID=229919 RepID=A0A3D1JH67_9CHLR|nr:hypothetical protein [Anaerolinea thermolimosa]
MKPAGPFSVAGSVGMESSPDDFQPLGKVQRLTDEQVAMIEEALARVGEFGEVRLKVEKGRLRFICVEQSFDALRWKGNPRRSRF